MKIEIEFCTTQFLFGFCWFNQQEREIFEGWGVWIHVGFWTLMLGPGDTL